MGCSLIYLAVCPLPGKLAATPLVWDGGDAGEGMGVLPVGSLGGMRGETRTRHEHPSLQNPPERLQAPDAVILGLGWEDLEVPQQSWWWWWLRVCLQDGYEE